MNTLKQLIITACILLLSAISVTHAQIKAIGQLDMGYPERIALSIPKEFTYRNTPMLTLYDDTEERNLLIYDDDINLVKTINMGQVKTFNYQLILQDEEREIDSIKAVEQPLYGQTTYTVWLVNQENLDPTFDESQLIITKEANGDSLIRINSENPNDYFHHNFFGKKYPRVYYRCFKGQVVTCLITYTIDYTEWHITGTHVENRQSELQRLKLCNINLNNGDGRANYYFEASQTLFNDDEAFEYIIPKYTLATEGFDDYYSVTEDPIYGEQSIVTQRSTVISEKSKLALAGFQVVSSNGTIVKELNFEEEFTANANPSCIYIISIGEKTYLAFDGQKNGKSQTMFYLINRKTADIKKVKMAPARLTAFPTVANHSENITVELDKDSKAHEITIINSMGQLTKRIPLLKGQKRVTFPAQGLASGLNIIHAAGDKTSSCKIIIR